MAATRLLKSANTTRKPIARSLLIKPESKMIMKISVLGADKRHLKKISYRSRSSNTPALAGLVINTLLILYCSFTAGQQRPDDFVNLLDLDPTIHLEMRYASSHNFLGRPVYGYETSACWLTEPAAKALVKVHQILDKSGFGLVIFDCYRPQHAVDDFVQWASQPQQDMKAVFYPRVAKRELFNAGYIAERSGHSRGSTVDLAIRRTLPSRQMNDDDGIEPERPMHCQSDYGRAQAAGHLDFGSDYDCFDNLSHTENALVSAEARQNRQFLVSILKAHGFINYPKEWWHFTFKPESYPNRYFDFPITVD
jgi:D-alanyl-D-alanine dipeptidase